MPPRPELIERSGDLKQELVEFSQRRKYRRDLDELMAEHPDAVLSGDQALFANLIDGFLLQHRLPSGRTLVEEFVKVRPDLPEDERAMLLGWRDVVEGVFLLMRREEDAVIAENLIDELTYRIHTNMGPKALRQFRPKWYLYTRIVPVEDEWLFSGMSMPFPPSQHRLVYELALRLMTADPSLVFRNPEKLEQAWEAQRAQQRDFVACFGSDEIVVPGSELPERLRAFNRYRMHEVRDEEGRTAVERSRERYGVERELPEPELPPDLLQADTVGISADEVEGLDFWRNYGLFLDAFNEPQRMAEARVRRVVRDYLNDDSISPLPFQRAAARYPEGADQVFQQVLRRPAFSWERDGEALLRERKREWFEREPLPTVTVVPDRITQELLSGGRLGLPRPRRRLRRLWKPDDEQG